MPIIKLIIISVNMNIFLLGIIFIFIKKGNALANILKGLFLIAAAYVTFSMTMLEEIRMFPHLIRVYEPFSLLLLPSLYIYFTCLIDEKKQINKRDLLHFTLPLLSLIILLPFLFKSSEFKLLWLESSIADYYYYNIWNFIYLSQVIVYIAFFVVKIRYFYLHSEKRKDSSRNIKQMVINFIILFLSIFTIGVILMIVFIPNLFFIVIPMQLFVVHGVYKLIKTSRMIEMAYPMVRSNSMKNIKSENLSNLLHYLETTNDYYIKDISLEYISRKLKMSMHEVSRYINENKKMNFNDFVNGKRVEEAKNRLYDPSYQHLSLEGIGQSVGFKSKTTFYRAFKKFTGKTPGEYTLTPREDKGKITRKNSRVALFMGFKTARQ